MPLFVMGNTNDVSKLEIEKGYIKHYEKVVITKIIDKTHVKAIKDYYGSYIRCDKDGEPYVDINGNHYIVRFLTETKTFIIEMKSTAKLKKYDVIEFDAIESDTYLYKDRSKSIKVIKLKMIE